MSRTLREIKGQVFHDKSRKKTGERKNFGVIYGAGPGHRRRTTSNFKATKNTPVKDSERL